MLLPRSSPHFSPSPIGLLSLLFLYFIFLICEKISILSTACVRSISSAFHPSSDEILFHGISPLSFLTFSLLLFLIVCFILPSVFISLFYTYFFLAKSVESCESKKAPSLQRARNLFVAHHRYRVCSTLSASFSSSSSVNKCIPAGRLGK